ncbi:MAG: YSC84-related protein [Pseudomonadota bacterium]
MTGIAFSRRGFTLSALAATSGLAACGNGVNSTGPQVIDARVETTLNEMYQTFPNTRNLADKASGMLVMPLITEAGLGFGGSYGRGSLQVTDATVDYYSAAQISGGLQFGAQQYAHVLFFMTEDSLAEFRASSGWEVGGDIQYVISDQGEGASADTTTTLSPIIALVFARAGLLLGATLQGTKYTRIIP